MSRIICVDFDGTCVPHRYPHIGTKDIGSVPVLKKLVSHGHRLILWTMRHDKEDSKVLTDAIEWFKSNDIPLWGIMENPEQQSWSMSRKVYAHLYIDDAAIGCPLVHDFSEPRAYVDWVAVDKLLQTEGYFS